MTILFAAGGTGGHIYPAIAIAEAIREKYEHASISFVGTKHKIEARIVPQQGYKFFSIWISGFSRSMKLSNILFPLKVVVALVQSFFLILKVKPDIVIGTGGYVCGPVLYIASLLNVTTAVHESNSYPGVTTRLVASRMSTVFITFNATRQWLSPKANTELVGNPTRKNLSQASKSDAYAFFGLDPLKKTVFVFGGSLGASSLNKAMADIVHDAIEQHYQIIWQTGETAIQSGMSVQHHESIKVMKYIDRMDLGYAVADLVISRSGATTLAELTRLGKPAILVPYPHAAANHQELNAQTMVDAGAAVMIRDAQLQERLLAEVHRILFNPVVLEQMHSNSLKLGRPHAGEEIAEKIVNLVRK